MTTRRLLLMRHAKSDWDAGIETDHQRPLNGRGKKDAPKIALCLKQLGWIPDLVLCSDATRTKQTFEKMTKQIDSQVSFLSSLYESSPTTMLNEIAFVSDDIQTLMILAHNPGISECTQALSAHFIELTTANVACFEAEIDSWANIHTSQGAWQLKHWLEPRKIPDLED
jgi:phosphohistidine phosphatase